MATIWGEKHDRLQNEFDLAVQSIQDKYPEIFHGKKNRFNKDVDDNIKNHYIITYNLDSTGIGFSKDSYIPKHIQREVIEAFKSIFSAK